MAERRLCRTTTRRCVWPQPVRAGLRLGGVNLLQDRGQKGTPGRPRSAGAALYSCTPQLSPHRLSSLPTAVHHQPQTSTPVVLPAVAPLDPDHRPDTLLTEPFQNEQRRVLYALIRIRLGPPPLCPGHDQTLRSAAGWPDTSCQADSLRQRARWEFENSFLLDGTVQAEDASDAGVEQRSERLGGTYRRSRDRSCVVVDACDVVDVGPSAAVKDDFKLGLPRTAHMDADRVGITHLAPLRFEALRPRSRSIAPRDGPHCQSCCLPGGSSRNDHGNSLVEVYDSLHVTMIACRGGYS